MLFTNYNPFSFTSAISLNDVTVAWGQVLVTWRDR